MNTTFNTYHFLRESARRFSDRIAITDESGHLTYAELLREVDQLATELQKYSEDKTLRLGICYANDRNFLIALFAGVKAGYIVMPVFHELTSSEISAHLRENKIAHFLNQEQGDRLYNTVFRLEIIHNRPDEEALELCPDPVFIRPTSGTTGKAKGVLMSHSGVKERITAANKVLNIDETSVIIWVLPMAFHFVVSLVLYVAKGARIVVTGGLDGRKLAGTIERYKGTLLYSSPLHIRLLSTLKEPIDLSSLQHVISTTTAVSSTVCHEFYKKYGIGVSQAYGIIEVGLPLINTLYNIEEPDDVGSALPDYEVAVFDDVGNQLSEEAIGNLGIKGIGMFAGYLNPLTKREMVLQNGFFMTGDIATIKSNGNVRILGRKKSMINVGGNKVFPQEVEFILEQYPGVLRARVYADHHPLVGEIVAAELVPEGEALLVVEDIISYCRKYLASFKLPQRIRIVEEVEMTASGKIKR